MLPRDGTSLGKRSQNLGGLRAELRFGEGCALARGISALLALAVLVHVASLLVIQNDEAVLDLVVAGSARGVRVGRPRTVEGHLVLLEDGLAGVGPGRDASVLLHLLLAILVQHSP